MHWRTETVGILDPLIALSREKLLDIGKEFLAVVWAFQKLRTYSQGVPFVFYLDHAEL